MGPFESNKNPALDEDNLIRWLIKDLRSRGKLPPELNELIPPEFEGDITNSDADTIRLLGGPTEQPLPVLPSGTQLEDVGDLPFEQRMQMLMTSGNPEERAAFYAQHGYEPGVTSLGTPTFRAPDGKEYKATSSPGTGPNLLWHGPQAVTEGIGAGLGGLAGAATGIPGGAYVGESIGAGLGTYPGAYAKSLLREKYGLPSNFDPSEVTDEAISSGATQAGLGALIRGLGGLAGTGTARRAYYPARDEQNLAIAEATRKAAETQERHIASLVKTREGAENLVGRATKNIAKYDTTAQSAATRSAGEGYTQQLAEEALGRTVDKTAHLTAAGSVDLAQARERAINAIRNPVERYVNQTAGKANSALRPYSELPVSNMEEFTNFVPTRVSGDLNRISNEIAELGVGKKLRAGKGMKSGFLTYNDISPALAKQAGLSPPEPAVIGSLLDKRAQVYGIIAKTPSRTERKAAFELVEKIDDTIRKHVPSGTDPLVESALNETKTAQALFGTSFYEALQKADSPEALAKLFGTKQQKTKALLFTRMMGASDKKVVKDIMRDYVLGGSPTPRELHKRLLTVDDTIWQELFGDTVFGKVANVRRVGQAVFQSKHPLSIKLTNAIRNNPKAAKEISASMDEALAAIPRQNLEAALENAKAALAIAEADVMAAPSPGARGVAATAEMLAPHIHGRAVAARTAQYGGKGGLYVFERILQWRMAQRTVALLSGALSGGGVAGAAKMGGFAVGEAAGLGAIVGLPIMFRAALGNEKIAKHFMDYVLSAQNNNWRTLGRSAVSTMVHYYSDPASRSLVGAASQGEVPSATAE